MAYLNLDEAREAGVPGSDLQVATAVAYAQADVEQRCRQWFEPTAATVHAPVSGQGRALLPQRPHAVTAVRITGSAADLPEGQWRVTSSATPGEVDAVYLASAGYDITIRGAEPWRGGYAALWGSRDVEVDVTGLFGWAEPPLQVKRATALLARIEARRITGDPAPAAAPAVDVDDEGRVVSIEAPGAGLDDTDEAEASRLLAPFIRREVLL